MYRIAAVAMFCVASLALCVWTPAQGQPKSADGSSGSAPATIQISQCRMSLIDDQTLSVGRLGVIEYIGLKTEVGKDENDKPKYKIQEYREGDVVTKGQVLIQLQDEVPAASLETATAEANNDIESRFQKKSAEFAKAELDAALSANQKSPNTFPAIEIKKLSLAHERGVLAVEQADHAHKVALLKKQEAAATLKTFQVTAPFAGVVTHIHKSRGDTVREGDTILQMADTGRVRVEGYATIAESLHLKKGMKVRVQQELDDDGQHVEEQSYDGTVTFVDVQVEKVNQKRRIIAEVDNAKGGLLAGRQARMTIDVRPSAKTAAKTR